MLDHRQIQIPLVGLKDYSMFCVFSYEHLMYSFVETVFGICYNYAVAPQYVLIGVALKPSKRNQFKMRIVMTGKCHLLLCCERIFVDTNHMHKDDHQYVSENERLSDS